MELEIWKLQEELLEKGIKLFPLMKKKLAETNFRNRLSYVESIARENQISFGAESEKVEDLFQMKEILDKTLKCWKRISDLLKNKSLDKNQAEFERMILLIIDGLKKASDYINSKPD